MKKPKTIGGNNAAGKSAALVAAKKAGLKIAMVKAPKAVGAMKSSKCK